MFMCPVCGYDRMLRPPAVGHICPCCGVEFEVDDDEVSHDELRRQWIDRGAPWFSRATRPPLGWNAILQLNRAGYREIYETISGTTQVRRESLPLNISMSDDQLTSTVSVGSRVVGVFAGVSA